MIGGVTYIDSFLPAADALFSYLNEQVDWDVSMSARKTASYGVAYNYSQMSYPYRQMPDALEEICQTINKTIGFKPNNCLINYYGDGSSKMGFHADQTDILDKGTGVVIVSLGAARVLRFKNITDNDNLVDYKLASGSLLYMDQDVQAKWLHAIPKSDDVQPRISLTFRKILSA
ncbi:alpha-ketoglutarate-dependent dioxygenase AlkB [Mucilaginibacter conchicola]|uniref:Alpha-ketoglutarate-dependent dioxygenase AlkB n=1 Tax=Mucilaginibacter conchicola TaxID=2303333 RepID=A0A372NZ81_9SPHI|nr:alpha-ketoglutarate-dependent dioxygenase AlkB [Mucilaginibacter conchicola]RFZ95420.1 alpha-ketoglutarate-dependent dioxygenase AlkB [Mucilaginibacter conchicola]